MKSEVVSLRFLGLYNLMIVKMNTIVATPANIKKSARLMVLNVENM